MHVEDKSCGISRFFAENAKFHDSAIRTYSDECSSLFHCLIKCEIVNSTFIDCLIKCEIVNSAYIVQPIAKEGSKFIKLANKDGEHEPVLQLGAAKDWPKRAILLPGSCPLCYVTFLSSF